MQRTPARRWPGVRHVRVCSAQHNRKARSALVPGYCCRSSDPPSFLSSGWTCRRCSLNCLMQVLSTICTVAGKSPHLRRFTLDSVSNAILNLLYNTYTYILLCYFGVEGIEAPPPCILPSLSCSRFLLCMFFPSRNRALPSELFSVEVNSARTEKIELQATHREPESSSFSRPVPSLFCFFSSSAHSKSRRSHCSCENFNSLRRKWTRCRHPSSQTRGSGFSRP